MAYEGGGIQPGSDMAGSQYKWCSLRDLASVEMLVPPNGRWMIERAVELYRLWRGREVELQSELDLPHEVKPK